MPLATNIMNVQYRGQTPWKNCQKLLEDIDKLPHGPGWKVYEIEMRDSTGRVEVEYLFARNVVEVVRELIGNPAFKEHMCFAPQRHWTAQDCKVRIYGEAWSGN